MKGRIIALGIAISFVVVYFAGYIHGNRSAAFICLEQAAADAHAGYKMLTDPVFARWKGETERMLLGSAVRALKEEKRLLQNPLTTCSESQSPYGADLKRTGDKIHRIEQLLTEWQGVLETNKTANGTEPPSSAGDVATRAAPEK